MTRMTGLDCADMCNLINTHTYTISLVSPWDDRCEWHRMARVTGPGCAVMRNLVNTYTHTPISIIDPPFGGSIRVA